MEATLGICANLLGVSPVELRSYNDYLESFTGPLTAYKPLDDSPPTTTTCPLVPYVKAPRRIAAPSPAAQTASPPSPDSSASPAKPVPPSAQSTSLISTGSTDPQTAALLQLAANPTVSTLMATPGGQSMLSCLINSSLQPSVPPTSQPSQSTLPVK